MSKTAIVKSGEKFFIKQLSKSQPIKLDQVIFANVPGINSNTDVDTSEKMPAANQIVHTAPVTQSGLLNDRTVVYSVILDTNVGDFSFNYIGLVNADTNTLCMVMHTDLTKKIKTAGQKQGNTITESIWLEMDNASESTGITVNAKTWQIDYSNRLAGEDERIRLTNYDLYNRLIILNGLNVAKNDNQLTVSAGLAYVHGLRVENKTTKSVTVDNNQSLYIDACLTGTVTGEWTVNYDFIAGTNLKNYERGGIRHYVERIAAVDANGKLKTINTKKFLTSDDLSSKIDSTDENTAATSLAVKRACDLVGESVKKNGDTMTGQLTTSKHGIKFPFENGNTIALKISNDNYSHIFYNAETQQRSSVFVYNPTKNEWGFPYVNDVTINGKSILKTGDYGIGSLVGASMNNPNDRLLSGWYATSTSDYPEFSRNDSATLVVYGTNNASYYVEQLVVAESETPKIFSRCATKTGKKSWIEAITTANVNNYIPVGTPLPWPGSKPPAGWFECNGSSFDKNKFPKLAAAYPAGSLPDLRGEFIRGWDNRRGVDPNRKVLSWQNDAIRNIYGEISPISESFGASPIASGAFKYFEKHADHSPAHIDVGSVGGVTFDASRIVPVANENRPRNIAFMYIVRAE